MAIGLATLLEDLGMKPEVWHGFDNQASLTVLQDTNSWRTRHLAIRSAVLRDMAREGIIKCTHVRSQDQHADGLTKFLKPEMHKIAVENWRIKPTGMIHGDYEEENDYTTKTAISGHQCSRRGGVRDPWRPDPLSWTPRLLGPVGPAVATRRVSL